MPAVGLNKPQAMLPATRERKMLSLLHWRVRNAHPRVSFLGAISRVADGENRHTAAGHSDQWMARRCLVCGSRFVSLWTGQRICPSCQPPATGIAHPPRD